MTYVSATLSGKAKAMLEEISRVIYGQSRNAFFLEVLRSSPGGVELTGLLLRLSTRGATGRITVPVVTEFVVR